MASSPPVWRDIPRKSRLILSCMPVIPLNGSKRTSVILSTFLVLHECSLRSQMEHVKQSARIAYSFHSTRHSAITSVLPDVEGPVPGAEVVAVRTPVSRSPPHRSVPALLTHTAPALGHGSEAHDRLGMAAA